MIMIKGGDRLVAARLVTGISVSELGSIGHATVWAPLSGGPAAWRSFSEIPAQVDSQWSSRVLGDGAALGCLRFKVMKGGQAGPPPVADGGAAAGLWAPLVWRQIVRLRRGNHAP